MKVTDKAGVDDRPPRTRTIVIRSRNGGAHSAASLTYRSSTLLGIPRRLVPIGYLLEEAPAVLRGDRIFGPLGQFRRTQLTRVL